MYVGMSQACPHRLATKDPTHARKVLESHSSKTQGCPTASFMLLHIDGGRDE